MEFSKVWVTKYALTSGVQVIELDGIKTYLHEDGYFYDYRAKYLQFYVLGKEAFTQEEDAKLDIQLKLEKGRKSVAKKLVKFEEIEKEWLD